MAASRLIAFSLIAGLVPFAAQAGPPTSNQCDIAKGIGGASIVYFDLNQNGLWNGVGGGDDDAVMNAAAGAGNMILGDWNGDGVADAGKQVGTSYSIDLNGNKVWDGNGGGDRNSNFGAAFGAGTAVVGDWDGDGSDDIGTYVAGTNTFYLDANGNGVWNGGGAGGDIVSAFAAFAGAGVPVIGDWNDDGEDDIGRYVGTSFYLDMNGNGVWDGNVGGDRVTNFAASFGTATPIVGDWDGDGDDEIGAYIAGTSTFLLDLNGNGLWNGGGAGGDLNVAFANFLGAGTPVVCDWDGDGDDNPGRVVTTSFIIDLNGNNAWDGNGGGDRNSNFAIGGAGTNFGAVIVAP